MITLKLILSIMNIIFISEWSICINWFKIYEGKTHAEFAVLIKILIGYELVMVSYV